MMRNRYQSISGVCVSRYYIFIFLVSAMRLGPSVLKPQMGLLYQFRVTEEYGAYV
jgi:hypothetical protein